jgi:hypothetical protein
VTWLFKSIELFILFLFLCFLYGELFHCSFKFYNLWTIFSLIQSLFFHKFCLFCYNMTDRIFWFVFIKSIEKLQDWTLLFDFIPGILWSREYLCINLARVRKIAFFRTLAFTLPSLLKMTSRSSIRGFHPFSWCDSLKWFVLPTRHLSRSSGGLSIVRIEQAHINVLIIVTSSSFNHCARVLESFKILLF